jgi:hypothetical protein
MKIVKELVEKTDIVTLPVVLQFSTQLREKLKSPNVTDNIIHPVTYQHSAEKGNFTKQLPNFMDSQTKPNFLVTC